jgi:nucleotide-binding universal stress UspA family protein
MAERSAVLVAVDGSDDSLRAVEWAVPEARRRSMPLVLVHVVPHLLHEDDAPPIADQRTRVDSVLGIARQRAAHAPSVDVEVRRLEPLGFEIGPALVDATRPGDLLVVGARGHGRLTGLVLGSVSQYATRHAPGTVVVVRRRSDADAVRTVVGFDDSPAAQRALDWAMQHAGEQGGAVTALRTWRGTALHGAANVLPLPVDAAWRQDKERDLLEAELVPWRDKYPGVVLVGEAVPGHPGHLLAVAAEHAALVVIGSRGRGALAETVLGSVSQAVLHHAHCPVAVVR